LKFSPPKIEHIVIEKLIPPSPELVDRPSQKPKRQMPRKPKPGSGTKLESLTALSQKQIVEIF
jgi:hypothetical protein